jgi:hypothetical protein
VVQSKQLFAHLDMREIARATLAAAISVRVVTSFAEPNGTMYHCSTLAGNSGEGCPRNRRSYSWMAYGDVVGVGYNATFLSPFLRLLEAGK